MKLPLRYLAASADREAATWSARAAAWRDISKESARDSGRASGSGDDDDGGAAAVMLSKFE